MGGHQSSNADTHTWLTPPTLLEALGPFDLDPCACPAPRPWSTAKVHWTRDDDALSRAWHGRVWCNPPYGGPSIVGPWMRRLADHGAGTALIFARTETEVWTSYVWRRATAILFLEGRLFFHRQDGTRAESNAGAPSALIAYGDDDAEKLSRSGLRGAFMSQWTMVPRAPRK